MGNGGKKNVDYLSDHVVRRNTGTCSWRSLVAWRGSVGKVTGRCEIELNLAGLVKVGRVKDRGEGSNKTVRDSVDKTQIGCLRPSHGEAMVEFRYIVRHRLDSDFEKRLTVVSKIKNIFHADGEIKLTEHQQMFWRQVEKCFGRPRPKQMKVHAQNFRLSTSKMNGPERPNYFAVCVQFKRTSTAI